MAAPTIHQIAADIAGLDDAERQAYRVHAWPRIDDRTWAAVTLTGCRGCVQECTPGCPTCPHCRLGHTTGPGPARECWEMPACSTA